MSKFACESITVPRKSRYKLHHDAHLQDKEPSVKALAKANFSNMLAKHAVTNTVTSMQGTGALWLKTGAVGSHLIQLRHTNMLPEQEARA